MNKTILLIIFLIFLSVNTILTSDDSNEFNLTQGQATSGKIIFERMVAKVGDVQKIKNIRTIGETWQPIDYGSITFEVTITAVFPDKFKIKFHDKEYIINDNKGWQKYPEGYFEMLPESFIPIIMGNLQRNIINLIKRKDDFRISYRREEVVDNINCDTILLKNDEIELFIMISRESGLPVQFVYENLESDKKEIIFKAFREYKKIDGILFPVHTISYNQDGEKLSEIRIKDIQFNIEIDEKDF